MPTRDRKEAAERQLLEMATPEGKFALQVGMNLPRDLQLALERLQLKRWVTLIDVTPVSAYPDRVCRIFLLSDEAMIWFKKPH
jgi:hypothetical protein